MALKFSHPWESPKTAKIRHENGWILAVYGPISPKPPQNFLFVHKNHSVKSKRKKLKKLGLKAMMPMLQKRPSFGMKMAESWLFMNQFPPNHHTMSVLVHKNNSRKLKKRKYIEENRSKSHDTHTPKRPKFGMKMCQKRRNI